MAWWTDQTVFAKGYERVSGQLSTVHWESWGDICAGLETSLIARTPSSSISDFTWRQSHASTLQCCTWTVRTGVSRLSGTSPERSHKPACTRERLLRLQCVTKLRRLC
ncbi:hypothetical protein D3C71_1787520 [compost metagenome]